MGANSGRWNASEASKFAVPHRGIGVLNVSCQAMLGRVPLPYLPRRLRQTDDLAPSFALSIRFFSFSPLERLFGGSWGDLGAILGVLGPIFGALASILAALE